MRAGGQAGPAWEPGGEVCRERAQARQHARAGEAPDLQGGAAAQRPQGLQLHLRDQQPLVVDHLGPPAGCAPNASPRHPCLSSRPEIDRQPVWKPIVLGRRKATTESLSSWLPGMLSHVCVRAVPHGARHHGPPLPGAPHHGQARALPHRHEPLLPGASALMTLPGVNRL